MEDTQHTTDYSRERRRIVNLINTFANQIQQEREQLPPWEAASTDRLIREVQMLSSILQLQAQLSLLVLEELDFRPY